jgi:hypothetical protein
MEDFQSPLHEHDGKWWFWDETWTLRIGPYDTETQASAALRKYGEEL